MEALEVANPVSISFKQMYMYSGGSGSKLQWGRSLFYCWGTRRAVSTTKITGIRQDSTFLYFFGLVRPNLAAVLDCEANTEIIFAPDPSPDEVVCVINGISEGSELKKIT
ncbi:aminopeptidase P N-terminal domain-containing protein [Pontibacter chitinilyticus]|uniref:aminopeptidase P N-terminal domain-containing protein n=1 Tax=Pontibacter chitinilyticus TaxID=2674989 RepID=UPI00321AAD3F